LKQVNDAPGTPVRFKAIFTPTNTSLFIGSNDVKPLTVTPEDAVVGYRGPYFAPTASSTASSTTVNLTAIVKQANDDSYPGDITKAQVQFLLYNSSNLSMTTPDAVCGGQGVSVNPNGQVSCSLTLATDTWTVIVKFGPNSYFSGSQSDPAVLTVYQPINGKNVAGSGTIVDPGYRGIPVPISPPNNLGSFGFNVNFKKDGITPQGSSVYTFRGADGNDYIIKNNSWSGGVLAFLSNTQAGFSGKATVIIRNPTTGQLLAGGGGNFKMRVDVTDVSSTGVGDTYSTAIYNSAGQLYHQAGTPTSQVVLVNGNIIVKSH
jgi:hypothetical protein